MQHSSGPMCGGFVCSKNALIALNVVYIVVGFVLIIVGAYAQQTSIVTSVPLVGGIIAMGVFLGVVAVFGIMTASRHHQVGLFFYMLILLLVFIVQFSVAIACLAVDKSTIDVLVTNGWKAVDNSTLFDVETNFNCCGLVSAADGFDCKRLHCSPTCEPCRDKLVSSADGGAQTAGGVGLFFSFTEILGIWLAMRYRNLKDPRSFPTH